MKDEHGIAMTDLRGRIDELSSKRSCRGELLSFGQDMQKRLAEFAASAPSRGDFETVAADSTQKLQKAAMHDDAL